MFSVYFVLIILYQTLGSQALSFLPLTSANGSPLCAVGNSSSAIRTDDIIGVPFVAPGATKCGYHCTVLNRVINCTGFNYFISGTCQFFSDPCVTVSSQNGCMYYQGAALNRSSVCTAKGSRILLQNKVASGTGTVSFNAGWTAYANGIGQPSMTDNYWIGNEKLYALTSGSTTYRLRVEIQRVGGSWLYAEYDSFIVGSSSASYQLNVFGTYSGNAGDAIRSTLFSASGKLFGTLDQDSGSCVGWNCAEDLNSGWWWACCTASNLNADANACWVPDGMTFTNNVMASRMYALQNI